MSKEAAKIEPPQMEIIFDNIRHPDVFGKVASDIQKHCKEKKLTMTFKGSDGTLNVYPMVEAWQFCGALLGLFPKLVSTRDLSKDNVMKYEATVEIIEQSSGKTIGSGVAICTNQEKGKQYFQEYAVLSMAQTRATGKAFRLCLGWIMKAAGFEPAPAEEIEDYEDKTPRGITDQQLLSEYRKFAYEAINVCQKAKDVEKLVKMAGYFSKEPAFIDNARGAYSQLKNSVGE
jgi:hypothetical protein